MPPIFQAHLLRLGDGYKSVSRESGETARLLLKAAHANRRGPAIAAQPQGAMERKKE
jgi:hypothetical protein